MAGTIKGMTIEIGGNTAPLEQALKSTNKEIKSTQKELNEVNKLLKLDPNNVTLLKQKQELLTKAIEDSTTKLDALKQAQAKVQAEMKNGTEFNQQEYRKLEREIAMTESTIAKLKEQVKETNPKLEKLKEGLQKVGDTAKEIGKKGLDITIKGVQLLGATAVATATSLLKMGNDARKSADELNTLSAQTGLTTEQIQKFKYASDIIDVDLNTLTGALKKTTMAMNNAKGGTGKSAEAFKKLGVNIKNADGTLKNNNDVFNESIRALGNIANETERDALAMELFGKSAQELNPLVKGGIDTLDELSKKAEKLGLVLSQDAIDKANKFNDQLDIMKANGQGLFGKIGNQVAQDLLPYMEKLNEATETVIGRLSKAMDEGGLSGLFDEVLKMFGEIDWADVAENLSNGINDMLSKLNEFLEKIDWEEVGNNIIEFIKNIDWATLIRSVFELVGGIIEAGLGVLKGAFENLGKDISDWWDKKMDETGGDARKSLIKWYGGCY